jgi:hypothetical protein
MVAVLALTDYRESESWKQARLAVCRILQFTESWSRRLEYRALAKNIEHLSVAVLDNLAKGYDGTGDSNFLSRAANTIEKLEQELRRVQQKGALNGVASALVNENLDAVKESLKKLKC